MELNWTSGNGIGRKVFMKAGSRTTDPEDGVDYTNASSVFGSGDEIGSGTFLVYSGSGSGTIISNLSAVVTYYFKVVEYNGSETTINYNVTETSGYGSGNLGSSSLPVSLLSFAAYEKNGNAELNWETATELNNDYFVIERSLDAENFTPIAQIQGAGNSNILQNYQYTDFDAPTNTVVYYRLHQYDFDGKDEVLQIVTLSIKESSADIQNVYVQNNTLQIYYSNPTGNSTLIKLVDLNGRILQMALTSAIGQQNLSFDLSGLSHGVYFITMEQENTRVTRKVVF